MESLWQLKVPAAELVLRAGIIYLIILFLLRLTGKREIGQMGASEFVSILLVSEAAQTALTAGDESVTATFITAFMILALTALNGYLSFRSRTAAKVLEGSPTLLIHRGEILWENLKKERLNADDLRAMLRKEGVFKASQVFQAVLELDGSVSVVKTKETETEGRHDFTCTLPV